jgi:hypothetical protein
VAADLVTVREELTRAGHLDDVGLGYLASLVDGVPKATNVDLYAGIVKDKARLRAFIERYSRLVDAAHAPAADVDQILADAAAHVASLASSSQGLVLTGLDELLAEGDDAIDYLVADRFTYGSVNLLAGRPKGGKSTLARALALAVARGERWLGSRCAPGNVVYVALEDKRSEVRRHLAAMGATGQEPIRFLIGAAPRNLLAKLMALIDGGDRIDLLIIDTAQRLLQVRDTNDYALVTTAFEPVLALARTRGTCIVLVHHAGKVDRAGLEAVLGSTAWAASVDNVMLVNRTERYRLVSTVQRIGPDLDETVLEMDAETGDVRLAGSRYLVDLQAITAAMVAAITEAGPGGVRRDRLFAEVEARQAMKVKALNHVALDPRVERVGAGTKSEPHVYRVRREPESGQPISTDSSTRVPSIGREPESLIQSSSINTDTDSSTRECAGSHSSQPEARYGRI